MNPHPLVSVIVPFYNTAPRFMREAVESVLGQSYPHWELLLVDDGSRSESTSVALRYAEEYPDRVRYLEHDGHRNRGAGATRQLGIVQAKGEYVAFLDADDVWLPHKLEQQVSILEAHPDVDMLYGNTEYWYSWTGKPEDSKRDYLPRLGLEPNRVIEPPELCALLVEGKVASPGTCSVLIRRDLIQRVGGFEGTAVFPYDDQSFYVKIYLEGRVFVADQCWDRYRQHPESGCWQAAATGRIHSLHATYLNWVSDYLSRRAVDDLDVWQAVRRQQWLHRHPTWLQPGTPPYHLMRRSKRRLLWMEERALPRLARRWLWVRGTPTEQSKGVGTNHAEG